MAMIIPPNVCGAPIYPQADGYLSFRIPELAIDLIEIMQTGDYEYYRRTKYEVWRPRPSTHSWAGRKSCV
jgi:hypothetical protein